MSLPERAKIFAAKYHKSRDNGYLDEVVKLVFELSPVSCLYEAIAVAWLHEAKFESSATKLRIAEEFGETIANSVYIISKKSNDLSLIKGCRVTLVVKLCIQIWKMRKAVNDTKNAIYHIDRWPSFRSSLYDKEMDYIWKVADKTFQELLKKNPNLCSPSKKEDEESFVDSLSDFLEDNGIEVSFQFKRNFTDQRLLGEYILDLEGAVRRYSKKSLDQALAEYRSSKNSNKRSKT